MIKGRKINQKLEASIIANQKINNKRVNWKDTNMSQQKRHTCLSLNNQQEKRKISISQMKKAKDSKTTFNQHQKISLRKPQLDQNVYPNQQSNIRNYSTIVNLNSIPQKPRLLFAQPDIKTHQYSQSFKTYCVNQLNKNLQHITYFVKVTQPPKIQEFRNNNNLIYSNQYLNQPSKSLSDSKLNEDRSNFIYPQIKISESSSDKIQSFINKCPRSKQQRVQSMIFPTQNLQQQFQQQYVCKTQPRKLQFRRTESFSPNSSDNSDNDSIVLQHFPVQQMNNYQTQSATRKKSLQMQLSKKISNRSNVD